MGDFDLLWFHAPRLVPACMVCLAGCLAVTVMSLNLTKWFGLNGDEVTQITAVMRLSDGQPEAAVSRLLLQLTPMGQSRTH